MVISAKYNKINEILNFIEEFGITDDGFREEKLEESTNQELEKIIEIYMEYGDLIWEYLLDEEIISKPDDFYFELSVFTRACDSAKGLVEDRYNPKSIHYRLE